MYSNIFFLFLEKMNSASADESAQTSQSISKLDELIKRYEETVKRKEALLKRRKEREKDQLEQDQELEKLLAELNSNDLSNIMKTEEIAYAKRFLVECYYLLLAVRNSSTFDRFCEQLTKYERKSRFIKYILKIRL